MSTYLAIPNTANTIGDTFDKSKNFGRMVFQKGKPVLDSELVELQRIQDYKTTLMSKLFGPLFLDNAFKVVERSEVANDFLIGSGEFAFGTNIYKESASSDHAGDRYYSEQASSSPAVRKLFWDLDAVVPSLTTPVADRRDLVVLTVTLRVIDSVEDPDIMESNINRETAVRVKLEAGIRVLEGFPGTLDNFETYFAYYNTEACFRFPVAWLNRKAGDATITSAMIEDIRATQIDSATAVALLRSGSLSIPGNLVIGGNLQVKGSTTEIETTELEVKDNIIRLNKGVTGAPTLDAGIEVDRGSETRAGLHFNETADRWEAGILGSLKQLAYSEEVLNEINTRAILKDVLVNTGDLLYKDSDGSIKRLPVGTDNQVLTSYSGKPGWKAPGSSGGSEVIRSFDAAVGTAIAIGDVLVLDSGYVKKFSSSGTKTEIVGIAVSAVADGGVVSVSMGPVVSGLYGLVADTFYYLSAEGTLTTTDSGYGTVGYAIDTTNLLLIPINKVNSARNSDTAHFDLIIDSDAKLAQWAGSVNTGAVYSRVLVKSGTWVLPSGGISLGATKVVIAEHDSLIDFQSASVGFYYDTLPSSSEYLMDGVCIRVAKSWNGSVAGRAIGMQNIPKLRNCTVEVKGFGEGAYLGGATGYYNCRHMEGCYSSVLSDGDTTAYKQCSFLSECSGVNSCTSSGLKSVNSCGYEGCAYLDSCSASVNHGSATGYGGAVGFAACEFLDKCYAYTTCSDGDMYSIMRAFSTCRQLNGCVGFVQTTVAKVKVFAGCAGLSGCIGAASVSSPYDATYIFNDCTNLFGCSVKGVVTNASSTKALYGFRGCSMLDSCVADSVPTNVEAGLAGNHLTDLPTTFSSDDTHTPIVAFSECGALATCKVNSLVQYRMGYSVVGYDRCWELSSCVATVYATAIAYGFASCTNLSSCTGSAHVLSYSTIGNNGCGFYSCGQVSACLGRGSGYAGWGFLTCSSCVGNKATIISSEGNSGKYSASYADSGTAAACADTAAGGWNS